MAGQYCGKIFADLGADVILVEPPGGSSVRREGPFLDPSRIAETSLTFSYFQHRQAKHCRRYRFSCRPEVLRKVVGTADLDARDGKAGPMKRETWISAPWSTASRSVVTSITPFGQTGPYANYESERRHVGARGAAGARGLFRQRTIRGLRKPGYTAHAQLLRLRRSWRCSRMKKSNEARGRHIDVSIQNAWCSRWKRTRPSNTIFQKILRKAKAGSKNWLAPASSRVRTDTST